MKRRLILSALALALLGATACFGYSYRPEPLAKTLAGELPNPLRLTRLDGTHVTLYDAQLAGDTLVGWNEPEQTARFIRYIVQVPVADVREVRVRAVDPGLTLLVWTAVPLAGLVVLVIANGGCMNFVLGC
jgi:hypothetical protein